MGLRACTLTITSFRIDHFRHSAHDIIFFYCFVHVYKIEIFSNIKCYSISAIVNQTFEYQKEEEDTLVVNIVTSNRCDQ